MDTTASDQASDDRIHIHSFPFNVQHPDYYD